MVEFEGKEHDDWWVTDFTWEELQQVRLVQERAYRDQQYNGKYGIASFAQYLEVASEKNVGVYPETKTPVFYSQLLPDFKMEDLMIEALAKSGIDADQIILQSFDTNSLGSVT